MTEAWFDRGTALDRDTDVRQEACLSLGRTLLISVLIGSVAGAALYTGGLGVVWSILIGWLVFNAAPLAIGLALVLLAPLFQLTTRHH